jgi:hypothetical protein|tara:strand:- start:104 stop:340 length:237 start_codon:yes stop_codon:yes gene_type:complete
VKIALISILTYFFDDLLGFNPGVFPGVFLLSRLRLSGLPVESAIGFGPGLRAIIVILSIKRKSLTYECSLNKYFGRHY